jgi:enoyl-CoA hydratase/carnithine racemase
MHLLHRKNATGEPFQPSAACPNYKTDLQRRCFSAASLSFYFIHLTSKSHPTFFCRKFWLVSNTFLARLYTSRLVTIAAIRGACPAGGCCLALCCDYRIITETGSIGLNEVALGISVPKYWGLLMQRIVGAGPAEKLLQFAVMATPEEAKELGLVDDVVPKLKLQAAAEMAIMELLKAPDAGRAVSC